MNPPLQSALDPGGPDAQLLSQLGWVLIIGGSVIFVIVMALLVYALRHGGRERRDPRRTRPAPQGTPAARDERSMRRWLLLGGAGIPALILLVLLGFSVAGTSKLSAPSSMHPLRITITAHMWWWEIRYYDAATRREAVLANELHIPAGVPVYLALTSADVIHAFWLPSLGGKVDMLPGRVHGMALRADRVGLYRGQCAEYCGAQHAKMALHLTVDEPEAFDAWLAQQAASIAMVAPPGKRAVQTGAVPAPATDVTTGAAAGAGAQLERGRAAFVSARCAACHSVRGFNEQPLPDAPKAPDLTHIGSRQTIAAGTLPVHRGTLAAWIADPEAIKPGARMPPASIDAQSVDDIAAWLESLK